MSHPPARTCAACGRTIAAGAVYYRFTLVLEGEQDVLDTPAGGTEDELASLLRQLAEGPEDARELEEQVHCERNGVVCSACRSVALRMLSTTPEVGGPH